MEHLLMKKGNDDMITFHYDGICLNIQTSYGDPEEFRRICLSNEDTKRLLQFLMVELWEELHE